jgi:hypothetical protein
MNYSDEEYVNQSESQSRSAEKEAKEETSGPRPVDAAAGGQSRSNHPGASENSWVRIASSVL